MMQRHWMRFLFAWALIPLLTGGLAAQQPVLRGRVLDPEGRAISGATVSLHHVAERGGAEVGQAVSDREGRFAIAVEPREGEGGVYFAATRFDGTLYMGAPFRTLAEVDGEYGIVVGAGGVDGLGGVAEPPSAPASGLRGWGLGLVLAAIAAAAILRPLRRARREPYRSRSLLLELAELEEGPGAEDRARRESLRARLRGSPDTDEPDAARHH
jgi:hypothetical protein